MTETTLLTIKFCYVSPQNSKQQLMIPIKPKLPGTLSSGSSNPPIRARLWQSLSQLLGLEEGGVFFLSWQMSIYLFPTTTLGLDILKQTDGRVCPKCHIVENTLFIAVSSMLHVFKMGRAVRDNGKEVPIPATFTSGMLWCIL